MVAEVVGIAPAAGGGDGLVLDNAGIRGGLRAFVLLDAGGFVRVAGRVQAVVEAAVVVGLTEAGGRQMLERVADDAHRGVGEHDLHLGAVVGLQLGHGREKMHPDVEQVVDDKLALEQVRREPRPHVGAVTGLVAKLLLDIRPGTGGGAEQVRRVVVRGKAYGSGGQRLLS